MGATLGGGGDKTVTVSPRHGALARSRPGVCPTPCPRMAMPDRYGVCADHPRKEWWTNPLPENDWLPAQVGCAECPIRAACGILFYRDRELLATTVIAGRAPTVPLPVNLKPLEAKPASFEETAGYVQDVLDGFSPADVAGRHKVRQGRVRAVLSAYVEVYGPI